MTARLRRSVRRCLSVLLLLPVAACATQTSSVGQLPFHVAIVPAVLADASSSPDQGDPTELKLAFDSKRLDAELETALAPAFTKVTRLAPPRDAEATQAHWLEAAQQQGADLLLVPTLHYDPAIRTSLNGQFWTNLPLFAIGGPFCWFVPDRSYHCYARLDGDVFDVTTAAGGRNQVLDATSRITQVQRESTEASLNFLDRADGISPYLLSVICPAGLVWPRSDAVPAQVDEVVTTSLCAALTKSLQESRTVITEARLVDFFPRDVRVERAGGTTELVGEFLLNLGAAQDLGPLRWRLGNRGEWNDALWSEPATAAEEAAKGRRLYGFRVPLGNATGTVQLQVQQNDRAQRQRTFTLLVPETRER